MEKHTNDRNPKASRQKANLSKKVERKETSARRSIKTKTTAAPISSRDHIGINAPKQRPQTGLVKKAAAKGARTTESAAKIFNNAENSAIGAVTSSADKSTIAGAVIAQGANIYQTVNTAKRKVVTTAIKTAPKAVKVVVKLPSKIQYIRRVGIGKQLKFAMRKKFRLRNAVKLTKKAAGSTIRLGTGIADKTTSALQNALNTSDTMGAAAMSTAIQGGKALATGAKVGAKTVKTGAKVAKGTAKITGKVTRKIGTRVYRSIANGTAKRTIKTSVQAAKATAKAAAKTAQVTAKAAAKFTQALAATAGRLASLIMSTAPMSFVIIGVIVLIILCAGMFSVTFKN